MRGSEQALNDQAVNPAATPLAACAETSGPGAAVAIQQNTQGQNVRFGGMTSKYASSGSRPRGTATATMPHVRVRPATESALTQINCALDPSASVTKTFPVWVCGTPKWTPYSDRYISVTVNSSGSSACPSGQFQSVNVNLTVKRTALEIPGGSDGIQLSGVNTGGLAVLVIVPATIEIQDLNVTAGNNVVSSPAPTPSPIMIGQQVQFKAVAVRGTIQGEVTWAFASPSANNVVSSYMHFDTPSPAPRSTAPPAPNSLANPETVAQAGLHQNPIPFFWLKGVTQHAWVTAMVQTQSAGFNLGVARAVRADVYYPIEAPTPYSAVGTTTSTGSQVSLYGETTYLKQQDATCPSPTASPLPAGLSFVEAIHLGNECRPHGTDWVYRATVPAIGDGIIYMVQLVKLSAAFSPDKTTAYGNGMYNLDGDYPYQGGFVWEPGNALPWAVLSGGASATLTGAFDAPATILDYLGCTSITRSDSFTDYFMYQPTQTASRPSIPVTIATMSWSWAGTAISTGKDDWSKKSVTSPAVQIASSPSSVLPSWPGNNDTILASIPPYPCPTPTPVP